MRMWTGAEQIYLMRRKKRQALGSGYAGDELLHPELYIGLIHKDCGIHLSNDGKHNHVAQLVGRSCYVLGKYRTEWGHFFPHSIRRTVTPQDLNQHNTLGNQGT